MKYKHRYFLNRHKIYFSWERLTSNEFSVDGTMYYIGGSYIKNDKVAFTLYYFDEDDMFWNVRFRKIFPRRSQPEYVFCDAIDLLMTCFNERLGA